MEVFWQQLKAKCKNLNCNSSTWSCAQNVPFLLSILYMTCCPFCLSCTVPKIGNKYSQKWNCAASFPIYTFIYSHNRSTCFGCIAFADRSWEYMNRSQRHECRNWERGRAVSFLEIFVSNFRYSAFAVCVIFYFLFVQEYIFKSFKAKQLLWKLSRSILTAVISKLQK